MSLIPIPLAPHEPAAGGHWAEPLTDRLQSVPGALGRVDLVDLALVSEGAFAPLARARRITLVLDIASGTHAVTGHRRQLLQLMVSLLCHAFSVTPHGGRVVLAVWRCAGDELLQVRDSGLGAPADPLTRSVDPLGDGAGGRDSGLAVVRQMAAAHGGWAGTHSAGVGHGTTFTVGLPALPAEA